jgi:hypothetical protein
LCRADCTFGKIVRSPIGPAVDHMLATAPAWAGREGTEVSLGWQFLALWLQGWLLTMSAFMYWMATDVKRGVNGKPLG